MAWKLPRRGGGFDTSGFDTSGGEQLWQAKTVSPTDPDVYQKGALWGSKLTHGGRNVNEAVEDYQDWSHKWGKEYKDENERLEKYKYKFGHDEDTIRSGFYRNYPSSYDLDFTIDDLNEQWYLPKEAPENYEWFNQGGIASLENRPGYRWAGEVKGSDWQPGRGVDTDWKYQGRDPEGNIQATWRTNRSGPEGTGGISWDEFYRDKKFGSDYWDKHGYLTGSPRQRTEFTSGPMSSDFFNEMYPTYDDQIMRGQRVRDYQNKLGTAWPDQPYSGWKSRLPRPYEATRGTEYGDEEGEFYQGGGAVGLEPGIGSLMGYAKGGMVTRVRVPKGQSKWMKKFINNMRDN